jgi:hypothetical protein
VALHQQTAQIHWARTDHNGLVTFLLVDGGAPSIEVSRGKLNDSTPNS